MILYIFNVVMLKKVYINIVNNLKTKFKTKTKIKTKIDPKLKLKLKRDGWVETETKTKIKPKTKKTLLTTRTCSVIRNDYEFQQIES
jgi:hypothetical protein